MQGASQKVVTSAGSANIAVVSDAVVYTKSFPLYKGEHFGVWARATSVTGTPNVKIELEQSWTTPTVEGSAETTLWVIPAGKDPIFSAIADELAQIATVTPVPMAYGRYKITGLTEAANPADTIVTIFNFIQE